MYVVYHLSWIWELVSVPRKIMVLMHIIDVEPDSIAGMVAFAQAFRNLPYLLL